MIQKAILKPEISIKNIRTIWGPSVYHNSPVLVLRVDLGDNAENSSLHFQNFIEKLLNLLPGLGEHTCSPGYVGGFVERLHRGTYLAHITEHVALELSALAGIPVKFGKTRFAGKEGLYDIVTCFKNEAGMKQCLISAVDLVTSIIRQSEFDVGKATQTISDIASDTQLGPSGQAIVDAAIKRNIPWRRIGSDSLIEFGYGSKSKRVQAAVTQHTGLIAKELVQDKFLTKTILAEASIPVSVGVKVSEATELADAILSLHKPLVVKPLDGNHGNGVFLNLNSYEEVLAAFEIAKEYSDEVLLEEMNFGKDYRLLVINGKLVAAAERRPPFVVGDGVSTIEMLIEKLNQDSRRGEGHQKSLSKIEVDKCILSCLNKQGLSLLSVLDREKEIILRENANLSSGGIAEDVTDRVHPAIRFMAERAARLVGLDICGLDLIHSDISLPINDQTSVIEINAGPGLRMHTSPSLGAPRDVGTPIIDMLFSKNETGRIPIVTVTGTNGKTTTVRLLHKIFSEDKTRTVGMTNSDGIWIGPHKISAGDTTGPRSAQTILNDPSVDFAVLETARGGLLRGGLYYDWSDVAVITNIRPDHLGQDGIEDLDDIIWIKSLVAERVKEGGTIVLNADDLASANLANSSRIKKIDRKIVYYSLDEKNPIIQKEIEKGHPTYVLSEGWLTEYKNFEKLKIVEANDLQFTLNGHAKFQISNALGAIAAARAMAASVSQIVMALENFVSTNENLGRMGVYKIKEGYAVLDYGHNPDAIKAVAEMLAGFKGYHKTAVLGLPGDRADHLLCECIEQAAKGFDEFILRDDTDRRGRTPGEVPVLMKSILGKYQHIKFQEILEESEAVEKALSLIKKNQIVFLFYDNYEKVMSVLKKFDPTPVKEIPELEDALNDVANYSVRSQMIESIQVLRI